HGGSSSGGGSGDGGGGSCCSGRTPTTQAQQLSGPAPQASPGAQRGGVDGRPHMTDKSRRLARAHWSRAGPVSVQSQMRIAQQRKAIGCC
ncbi:unnamed protein product, partial [Gulo gulo]